MKILVIGSLEHEDSFATNIVQNFIKLGHETHAYDTFSLRIKINNKFGIIYEDKLIVSFAGGLLFYDACFNDVPHLIEVINADTTNNIPDWVKNIINYFGLNIKRIKSIGDTI